jgi:hypothetical protein
MKKIQDILMPDYHKNIPEQEFGEFVASTCMLTPELGLTKNRKIYSKVFTDLISAYKYARLRALWRGFLTWWMWGNYGVSYMVFDKKYADHFD